MVRQDPTGRELLPGKPPLRVVRTERLGGRWDTVQRKFTGPASRYLVWHVSEIQAGAILGQDPKQTRTLLYSAEGGGKTEMLAMWGIVQVIRLAVLGVFVAGGATAPTHERLQTLVKAVRGRIPTADARSPQPGAWATWFTDARELRFVTGHVIQFRSTKKQSSATGSPVQGFTWGFSMDDEIQDTAENGADPDIEARLRGVKTSRRMATATAKDSYNWRTQRDKWLTSQDWGRLSIPYSENPFVWPEHWERMRRNMSPREWQRRGLAMDVGPERMLYHTWSRELNLRPVPRLGKSDITPRVVGAAALVGHDPGKIFDVSLLLFAYEVEGKRNWWVRDEFTTESTTIDQHIAGFKARLQDKWQLQYPQPEEPKALVRCDPYSDSSDNQPDRGVYTAWKLAGFDARSAAYNARGEGKGRVPKEARIEMVCRLICNAAGERRLFVECDDRRQPVAPKLVESIELSERDEAGRAEAQRKDKRDLSHWTAALGYALWPYERLREFEGVRSARGLV